jgi:hypothetical protein
MVFNNMKKLLILTTAILVCLGAPAATLYYGLTNFVIGQASPTNYIRLTPVQLPVVNNPASAIGIPQIFYPTNGWVTNSLNGGGYKMEIQNVVLDPPFLFQVGTNDPSTYNVLDLRISGGNFYALSGIRKLTSSNASVTITPANGVGVVDLAAVGGGGTVQNPYTNSAFGISNATFAAGMSLGTNGNIFTTGTIVGNSISSGTFNGGTFTGSFVGNGGALTNLSLTPWTSDINGGGHQLTNASFSVGSPSGFISSPSNINFYIGTNYGFFIQGQNNGTNTPLVTIPWVGAPGKWYFNVGVQNPSANAGEGIKDCHFYMENAYFFDLFDETKNLYTRFAGNGLGPHKDGDGNSYGDMHFVYNGGSFIGVAYPAYDYGANLFPTHIESQQTPFTQTAPVVAKTANIGSTGTVANQALDTDTAQLVTLTIGGSGIAAGNLWTNTYDQLFDPNKRSNPNVILTPANANAAGVSYYIFSSTISNSVIAVSGALTTGQTYIWEVTVIQ